MPSFTKAGYRPLPQKETKPAKKKKKKPNKKRPSPAAVISVSVFILALALSVGTIWLYRETKEYANAFLPGIFLAGESIDGMTYEQAERRLRELEEKDLTDFSYTLECEGMVMTLTADDLELSYDIEATLMDAYQIGRDSGMISKFITMLELRAQPVFLTPVPVYSLGEAENALAFLKDSLECDPVDAGVSFEPGKSDMFSFTEDMPGVRLLTEDVLSSLEEACRIHTGGTYVIEAERIAPSMTRKTLEEGIRYLSGITVSLGDAGDTGAVNAELALLQMNGQRIDPGESLSFNETVGTRNEENGFEYAQEPAYGLEVYGIGGGVSRASSLLYQGALLAGLDISERSSAAVLVDFCTAGEEAAVSDQGLDLVIRNQTALPVFIRCRVYESSGTKICTLEFFGERMFDRITLEHEVSLLPASLEPVYMLDREGTHAVYSDERVVRNEAIDGQHVTTWRVVFDPNGIEISREMVSEDTYEPIPQCIWVGQYTR